MSSSGRRVERPRHGSPLGCGCKEAGRVCWRGWRRHACGDIGRHLLGWRSVRRASPARAPAYGSSCRFSPVLIERTCKIGDTIVAGAQPCLAQFDARNITERSDCVRCTSLRVDAERRGGRSPFVRRRAGGAGPSAADNGMVVAHAPDAAARLARLRLAQALGTRGELRPQHGWVHRPSPSLMKKATHFLKTWARELHARTPFKTRRARSIEW